MADVTFSVFAGIKNTVPAERLHALPTKDNATVDLAAAVNVDIDDSGQLSRRAGQVLHVAGAAHSLWADGDTCLYVADATLRRLQPDMSSVALATVSDNPMAYVEVNARVYWSNGVETGVVDGLNRAWGMSIPASAQLGAIAGTLTAGTYQVALTHQRRDGQESGAGLTAQITLADGAGIAVAWSRPEDADIVAVNVYLSEPNGMVPYLAGTFDIGSGSAAITGPALAVPLNTQWLDAPPAGQCLTAHNGRILIAAGAYVFGTVALGYEYVDLRDYLAIDGSRIGFLIGVRHGLYIGTAHAVYFAAGERLEEYSLKRVVDAACVPRSALLADGMAVTGNPDLAGRQVALFATSLGICLGLEDGSVVPLTQERFAYQAGATGAAIFRNEAQLTQYLLFMPS